MVMWNSGELIAAASSTGRISETNGTNKRERYTRQEPGDTIRYIEGGHGRRHGEETGPRGEGNQCQPLLVVEAGALQGS